MVLVIEKRRNWTSVQEEDGKVAIGWVSVRYFGKIDKITE